MKQRYVHATVLLFFLIVSTIAVGAMTKTYFMVIFMAALTAALLQPVYRFFHQKTKMNEGAASSVTLIALVLGILLPLTGVVGMFVSQAVQISQKIQPKIQKIIESESSVEQLVHKFPYGDLILTYQDQIIAKGGEIAASLAMFFTSKLGSFGFSAVQSIFLFFLYLYSLFFLIKDGKRILNRMLYLLPLPSEEESRLLQRFTSVTKATLKGTVLIGMIQGGLAGVALALAGVESALFWSILMMILSVIPVVGTILVWLPAAIVLIISGSVVPGILVLLWCGIVVGNLDNLLRPKLVGQDAGLHELLILFSTLGGLSLFGMVGFIVGPIVAALWVTLWDIYGEMFKDFLPPVESLKPAIAEVPVTEKEPSHIEEVLEGDSEENSTDIE